MDGSGKALQSKLLVDWLQKHGYGTKYIDFPRYYTSFHGQNVGRFLRGEFGTNLEVNPYLASVLYAMDRLTARDELIDWLKNKNIVVANRYTTSNFAFQSAKLPASKRKKFIDWLYQMEYKEHGLPKEDVVLFLYVPLSVSQKLLEKKQGTKARRYIKKGKDIHEQDVEFQRQVLKMYLKLCRQFKHWEKIVCVDNKNQILPPDKIQKKIIQILKKRKII
jgi:dTMP kinase